MPSAIWTGHIAFGLVSIGVRVVAATESKAITFRQIHLRDGARLRHERICTAENRPVPWEEVGRGYETPDGRIVPVTEDDLMSLPLPTARTIEVLEFVPLESIDPIHYQRTYYLDPAQPTSVRPYVLLRDTLEKSGRVGVTKVSLRCGRERLAMLRQEGSLLVAHLLYWPDEITPASDHVPPAGAAPHPAERQMARTLIEAMSGDFHPEQWHDRYRDAIEARIADKLSGRPTEAEAVAEPVSDLEAALRKSINEARGGRGTATPKHERPTL
ncbi:non-homologous end joining protein Ku [Saccharopolyspora elongata]|uniref:Non-homologous end joining protein Ku n=1 Tax=Saccharopolyspora elongata TaxID=2530387 RepID=A0A4R4Y7H0_9PSEU|nr:Ku protein [Saccharopolyspora elongata]TDD40296.1 Ku protein [Saccharopolyspora elongata]